MHVCVGGIKADNIIACIGAGIRGHLETKGRAPDHERSSVQRLYRPLQRGAKGLEGVGRVGAEA